MQQLQLTKKDQNKWFHNIVVFLAPLGVLYLTTITGVISQENHSFSFNDLIPNSYAQGGMILWTLNSALDYLRKLKG